MQHEKELICGVDIGSSKITAVIGIPDDYGRLEILGIGVVQSKGIVNGQLQIMPTIGKQIGEAVKMASEQAGADIRVVNVGISSSNIRCLMLNNSFYKDEMDTMFTEEHLYTFHRQMYKTRSPAGTEIVHVLPQDYVVDGSARMDYPVGSLGQKLEASFNVVCVDDTMLKTLKASLKHVNLELNRLILEPLACSFAALGIEEKEDGVALINIGAVYTSIIIYVKNCIRHLQILPIGGNMLTSDLKEAFHIRHHYAEVVKKQLGNAIAEEVEENAVASIPSNRRSKDQQITVRNIAKVLEACLEEKIKHIHEHLICSGWEDKLGAGIILTGGGAQLKNLDELFEYITGIRTRISEPNELIADNSLQKVKHPGLTTATGLALAELLNEEEKRYLASVTMNEPTKKHREKAATQTGKGILSLGARFMKNLLNDDIDQNYYPNK